MKYMDHDWEWDGTPVYSDRQFCKRCGSTRIFEERNIPCSTITVTWYRDPEGRRVDYPKCVEREQE